MILKVVNVITSFLIIVANLFFLFVSILGYGYQPGGLQDIFYNYLIAVSALFFVSGIGAMFFLNKARKGLLLAAFITACGLVFVFFLKSEYYYFYYTQFGILIIFSVFAGIFFTRRNVQKLFR